MPTPSHLKAEFLPGAFFHILCKSIDGLLLFNNDADYLEFKSRFRRYCCPFFDVWSYILLVNHSHYVIKINSLQYIVECISQIPVEDRTVSMNSFLSDPNNELLLDAMIERQMNSFLVSYSNFYNTQYNRKGGLFQKPFKRIQVTDDTYLQQAIIYTNANAQRHSLVKDFTSYAHSSYHDILQNNDTWIKSREVIEFFGGRDQFADIHEKQAEYYYSHNGAPSNLELE